MNVQTAGAQQGKQKERRDAKNMLEAVARLLVTRNKPKGEPKPKETRVSVTEVEDGRVVLIAVMPYVPKEQRSETEAVPDLVAIIEAEKSPSGAWEHSCQLEIAGEEVIDTLFGTVGVCEALAEGDAETAAYRLRHYQLHREELDVLETHLR